MIFQVVKHLHLSCVVLSVSGFVLRGIWMLSDSPLLARRPVRIVPHVVDTLLLGSAIALAVISAQYPFVQSWLTAKVVGLVLYVLLGTMALKRGRTKASRAVCFVLALLVFAWIVSVALTRSPYGVFS